MLKISLKGLWAHKRRLVGTLLAVFLGVAFLSGTLVLGDTLRANFASLFTTANGGTDAVVRSADAIQARSGRGPAPGARVRGLISAALVDRARSVPGVAAAEPSIQGFGQLVGKDGKAISGNGAPSQAANWIGDPDLTPYRLVDGRAPSADDEVVVNRGAAKSGGLRIGDITTVQTPEPVRVRIVGIATWGTADGFGKTTYTAFTLQSAERHVIRQAGQVSNIAVKATPGVSQDELVRRLQPLLPPGVEALTAAQVTKETTDELSGQFLDLFRTFLLVFAGIALLVATFSIANTFSILVAQRRRESALLRAIGASRGQILGSVVVEALLVGLVASAAGLLGGFGIAGLLKGLFKSFGFALPASGLVVTATTVVVPLVVGTVVTLAAGVVPAVKASRVPPLAALRDVAADRASASAWRAVAGVTLTAIGVVVVVTAVVGGGGSVLFRAGLGALLTLVGVVVFGPVVARAAIGFLGSPLPRLRGIAGALARQNAMRNPRRTSGTAAALLVGVGVVTLFTVFAASLKASIDHSVSTSFGGDLTISTGGFGAGGLSPRLVRDIGTLPEVQSATGLGQGIVRVDGDGKTISIADPARLGEVLDLDVAQGSITGLGDHQLAVSKQTADGKGWRLGATVPAAFADGTTTQLTVAAIYQARNVAGDYLLSRAAWTPHAVQDLDSLVFVKLKKGVGLQAGKTTVEQVAKRYGSPTVQDRQQFTDTISQGINMFLGIVYALLALAILIALLGIANTLSLSIHERTRELGLLRAVGQTRGQLRSMVRWESVIIALFGTIGGLCLGAFLGWALVQAASKQNIARFSAPVGQLLAVLVAGAVAGVLAGVRPARRAAKLNVLEAIATE